MDEPAHQHKRSGQELVPLTCTRQILCRAKVIGTIRRETLDHILIIGEAHARKPATC